MAHRLSDGVADVHLPRPTAWYRHASASIRLLDHRARRRLGCRSARGLEAEGFDCLAAARHWLEGREAEEADDLAAIADFEADQIREAA